MKTLYALIVITLLFTAFCLLPVFSRAQPGSLDPTFGIGGIVITDLGSFQDIGNSVAIQSDGKIVVGGYSSNTGGFALVRYNYDGTLDGTFGSGGIVTIFYGDIWSLAIQTDGKIVAASGIYNGSTQSDFGLVRCNTDGSLDNTFGSGGIVTTDFDSTADVTHSVAIQSDGKIVLAGESITSVSGHDVALARYTIGGSLDSTFGLGGKVTMDFGTYDEVFRSIVIQTDGKIVSGGYISDSTYDFLLTRYRSDGNLDSTFGSNGVVITDFGSHIDDFGFSIAIQNDGKILLAGYSSNDTTFNSDFSLVRYNNDGSLDNLFGLGGNVITDFGSYESGNSIALQGDGKIVMAGSSANDFALARYNNDGSLDSTFGSNGKVTTDFGINYDGSARSIAIQTDGKIVVAGYSGWSNGGPGWDFTVARYDGGPVGVSENIPKENAIVFSPNPFITTSILTINSNIKNKTTQLKIYDMIGRKVSEYEIKNSKTEINRENLSPGIYFYKVGNGNEIIGTGKLIVQ